ncbi:MAG: GNAT family N-acetyltransferase [Gemmatimonadota bacterium]
MKIFTAGADHAEEVARLFDMYRVFYGQPSDLEGARTFVAARLRRGDSHILCCALDDEIVGFTQLYPSFSSVRMRPVWILNDLFVDPSVRRRGVARALMRAARRHAADTGATYLTLETHRENTSAQAVYAAEGWTRDDDYYHFSIGAD